MSGPGRAEGPAAMRPQRGNRQFVRDSTDVSQRTNSNPADPTRRDSCRSTHNSKLAVAPLIVPCSQHGIYAESLWIRWGPRPVPVSRKSAMRAYR
jgi:hypothetical protein